MANQPPIFIANWKMQLTLDQTVQLIKEVRAGVHTYEGPVQLVVCPTYTALSDAHRALEGSKVKLGAQDVFWDERGAYTGEVSPLQLQELGVQYVIIGHSERRQHFGETDEMVARKLVAALSHGLQPILCVGETGAERAAHQHEHVVRRQLTEAFRSLPPPSQGHRFSIAYEPIWAIGTGESANPDQATEMRHIIFQTLVDLFDEALVERQFSILYGGSVDPANITKYVQPGRYDGALAGTASLKADSFVKMVEQLSTNAHVQS